MRYYNTKYRQIYANSNSKVTVNCSVSWDITSSDSNNIPVIWS